MNIAKDRRSIQTPSTNTFFTSLPTGKKKNPKCTQYDAIYFPPPLARRVLFEKLF